MMRPDRTASISAASSTIGPRDVLIRIAPCFIIAMSGSPISPRERDESTKWMLTASESDKRVSLETKVAPAACARSAVRFSLQAMTVISNSLSRQADPSRQAFLKASGADIGVRGRDRPRRCQQQTQRQFGGGGRRAPSAGVANRDAAGGACVHVERAIALTRDSQHAQPGEAVDERGRQRSALAHGEDNLEIRQLSDGIVLIVERLRKEDDLGARQQRRPIRAAACDSLPIVQHGYLGRVSSSQSHYGICLSITSSLRTRKVSTSNSPIFNEPIFALRMTKRPIAKTPIAAAPNARAPTAKAPIAADPAANLSTRLPPLFFGVFRDFILASSDQPGVAFDGFDHRIHLPIPNLFGQAEGETGDRMEGKVRRQR